jgi:hypothetical protein
MDQQPHYSDEEIARAWIRRFSQNRTSILLAGDADAQIRDDQRIEVETKWAFDELEKLVENDPARAWAVILCILNTAHQDENALDNLAAGPLETLLARHGRDVVERVEAEAKANPKFKKLLKGVWGNAIDEAVWAKVRSLSAD